MSTKDLRVTMFFDGACPICSREARFLMKRNRAGHIKFEDTSRPGFDPKAFGIPTDTNRVIHGLLPDGTVIRGMEVFRAVYKAIGLGFLMAPTGWPILRPIFDAFYLIFAKNRMRIGKLFGRCEQGSCEVK